MKRHKLKLIPTEEEIHIANKTKKFVTKSYVTLDDKKITELTLSPGDIDLFPVMKRKLGEKIIGDLTSDEWSQIAQDYKRNLSKIPCREIYYNDGFVSKDLFILGNISVTSTFYKLIVRGDSQSFKEIFISPEDIKNTPEILKNSIFNLHTDKNITIIWTCVKVLGFLSPFLPRNLNSFSAMLAVIGKSGTKKTSSASAFFNPQSSSNLHSSFEDTIASIKNTLKMIPGQVLLIDDLSNFRNPGKQKDTLEAFLRLAGDTLTEGKKVKGGNIDGNAHMPLIAMTGEFLPELQLSSLSRLLVTDISSDSVNTKVLSDLQASPQIVVSSDIFFIQKIMKNPKKISELQDIFIKNRNQFMSQNDFWHPRCYNIAAWLLTVADFVNFCVNEEIIILSDFKAGIKKIMVNQFEKYGKPDPVDTFISTFYEMYCYGELEITDKLYNYRSIIIENGNLIMYAGTFFDKVLEKIHTKGIYLDEQPSRNSIYQKLTENNILIRKNGNATSQKRFKNLCKTDRCVSLRLYELEDYMKGNDKYEEI